MESWLAPFKIIGVITQLKQFLLITVGGRFKGCDLLHALLVL
jgi:hypothetical protein